jgi:hypothetical protein
MKERETETETKQKKPKSAMNEHKEEKTQKKRNIQSVIINSKQT